MKHASSILALVVPQTWKKNNGFRVGYNLGKCPNGINLTTDNIAQTQQSSQDISVPLGGNRVLPQAHRQALGAVGSQGAQGSAQQEGQD